MKRNIVYCRPYSVNHPVIVMFFNVLSSWDNENIGKLLHFWTGSSQVPINGFAEYQIPVQIQFLENTNHFPRFHTCFNTPYENEDVMNNRLLEAIQVHEVNERDSNYSNFENETNEEDAFTVFFIELSH